MLYHDAVVAPSHYAAHTVRQCPFNNNNSDACSFRETVQQTKTLGHTFAKVYGGFGDEQGHEIPVYVIPPGVRVEADIDSNDNDSCLDSFGRDQDKRRRAESRRTADHRPLLDAYFRPCKIYGGDGCCVRTVEDNDYDGEDGGCLVVGFIGRMVSVKSPGLFLLAMKLVKAALPGAVFLMVGGGPMLEGLKAHAFNLGLGSSIAFTGLIDRDSIHRYIRTMDVVVMVSQYETFGIANIEAMAQGYGSSSFTALITFGTFGQGEYLSAPHEAYLEDRNSFLINENTAESIASATRFLLENSTLRKIVARNGYQTVMDHFTSTQSASRYRKLYAALINR